MNEKPKKKLVELTVAEAKAEVAKAKEGDNLVWGTLTGPTTTGTKAEAEAFLASADDGDAIVWGN